MYVLWSNYPESQAQNETTQRILYIRGSYWGPTQGNDDNFLSCIPRTRYCKLNDDSNDPTFPYGFGANQPIVSPSLNNLILPPDRFNISAAITVVQQNPIHHDNYYSLQSPKPSEPSPTSTTPMNLKTFDSWETPHTTTVDNTFYSEDEPSRVYWTSPVDETFHSETNPDEFIRYPVPPRQQHLVR